MFPSTPDAKSMGLLGGPSKASRIPGAPGEPVPAVRCSHVRSELAPGTPVDVSRTCLRKGGVATRVPATPVPPRVFRPHPFRTRRGDSRWTCLEIVWRGGISLRPFRPHPFRTRPRGSRQTCPNSSSRRPSNLEPGSSILDPRFSALATTRPSIFQSRPSMLGPRSSVFGSRSSVLDPLSSILNPRSSNLDPGSLVLDPRISDLGYRFSVLDPLTSNPGPRSSILTPQFSVVGLRPSVSNPRYFIRGRRYPILGPRS